MTKNTPEKTLSIVSSGARGVGFRASGGMAAAVASERRASANQEQAAAPQPAALRSRLQQRRTALEQLLDIELDEDDARGRRSEQDNQEHAVEDDPALQNVSLELLALLSPHGTTQQWEDDDDADEDLTYTQPQSRDTGNKPTQLPRPSGAKSHHYNVPDVMSPTELTAPFAPSPIHSADGDEFDMASPLALPEEPQALEQWKDDISINYEEEHESEMSAKSPTQQTSPSTTRKQSSSRASPSTFARRTARTSHSPQHQAWTPGKSSHYGNATESKAKVRHGGIYSLLLKNKPPEHEPMLVDEKRSPQGPEVSPMLHSVNKKSSPPSFAKIQHGGIYGMLRRNSKNAD